jgi:phage terminase Nu1 subunit (DNA packaging protein)
MDKEFMTINELEQMFKVSRTTIDRWRKSGLPCIKIGRGVRFERDIAIKWIQTETNK